MAAFRGRVCVPARSLCSSQARALRVCGTLMGSDTAASGPSPLHQPPERLPESQNTTPQPGAGQGKALLRCSWQGLLPYLAETLVVKETQSLENVSGVVPVMSSHCAGEVPPVQTHTRQVSSQTLGTHRLHKEHLYLHTLEESLDVNVLQQLSSTLSWSINNATWHHTSHNKKNKDVCKEHSYKSTATPLLIAARTELFLQATFTDKHV